jgi:uncharacterized radical SAM protein YgiQ
VRLLKRGVPFSSLKTAGAADRRAAAAGQVPCRRTGTGRTSRSTRTRNAWPTARSIRGNFKHIETESNRVKARRLLQQTGDRLLVVNPPFPTMSETQIDASFDLPYTRLPHPKYRKRGPIPAYEMIKHSINMHRGCFGGCSFCTISAHQGKFVASARRKSILREVESIKQMPDFRGTISDLGGPSANMYKMKGKEQWICDECVRPSCIWPDVCRNLDTDHTPLLDIYKACARPRASSTPTSPAASATICSSTTRGHSPEARASHEKYIEELAAHHVPGRIKVAPEHTSDHVLRVMRKPGFNLFHKFKEKFDAPRQGGQARRCRSSRISSARIPDRARRTWPSSRSRPRTSASASNRCRISPPRR